MAGLIHALEAIQNGNEDLYALELEGIEIVFRLPSIKQAYQYQKLLSLTADYTEVCIIYEHMFKAAVLNDYMATKDGDLPAGIPETIAKLIFMLSGADEHCTEYTEELVTVYRKQADNTLMYMKRIICQVFAGYTFKSLNEENYQTIVNLFIQAEKVLLERGIIETVHQFNQPEEAKPKPFRVEDVIRHDANAQAEFDKPKEDANTMARVNKIRQEAIKRAKDQELAFRRKTRR
jgi:hypothetical protein